MVWLGHTAARVRVGHCLAHMDFDFHRSMHVASRRAIDAAAGFATSCLGTSFVMTTSGHYVACATATLVCARVPQLRCRRHADWRGGSSAVCSDAGAFSGSYGVHSVGAQIMPALCCKRAEEAEERVAGGSDHLERRAIRRRRAHWEQGQLIHQLPYLLHSGQWPSAASVLTNGRLAVDMRLSWDACKLLGATRRGEARSAARVGFNLILEPTQRTANSDSLGRGC